LNCYNYKEALRNLISNPNAVNFWFYKYFI
jgi:hypothetical protein